MGAAVPGLIHRVEGRRARVSRGLGVEFADQGVRVNALCGPRQHPAAEGAVREGPREGGEAPRPPAERALRGTRGDRSGACCSWRATTRPTSPRRSSSTAASQPPTSRPARRSAQRTRAGAAASAPRVEHPERLGEAQVATRSPCSRSAVRSTPSSGSFAASSSAQRSTIAGVASGWNWSPRWGRRGTRPVPQARGDHLVAPGGTEKTCSCTWARAPPEPGPAPRSRSRTTPAPVGLSPRRRRRARPRAPGPRSRYPAPERPRRRRAAKVDLGRNPGRIALGRQVAGAERRDPRELPRVVRLAAFPCADGPVRDLPLAQPVPQAAPRATSSLRRTTPGRLFELVEPVWASARLWPTPHSINHAGNVDPTPAVLSRKVKKQALVGPERLARARVLEVVGVDEGPTEAFDQLRRIVVRLQIDGADPLLKRDHRFTVASGVGLSRESPALGLLSLDDSKIVARRHSREVKAS